MADTRTTPNRKLALAFAESSRDLVSPLARALEAAGFELQPPPANQAEADAAIDAAATVLVCWTPAAVASDSVNLQAARARKARKLAPVLLAPCAPPANLGGGIGVSDLTGWRGDPSEKEFLGLVQSIHARLSGRVLSGEFWKSRYFTWGGAGAVALAAIAVIGNFGDFKQAIDDVVNPAASERSLDATDAKVDEVLRLLKGKADGPLDAGAEAVMRESIERLLSAQDGARAAAKRKLVEGDIGGAVEQLRSAASEGEKAVLALAETWKEIGALSFTEHPLEAIDAYGRAAELNPGDLDSRLQIGGLRVRLGHFDLAEQAYLFVTEHAAEDGEWERAVALVGLGGLAAKLGRRDEAEEYLKEALAVHQKLGMKDGEAATYADMGLLRQQSNDLKGARELYRRSLALFTETDNSVGQTIAYQRLGNVALRSGDIGGAEKAFNSALAIARRFGDPEAEAIAIGSLGDVAADRGDIAGARRFYLDGLEIAERISAQEDQAYMLVALGELEARDGHREEAMRRLVEARELYSMMGLSGDVQEIERQLRALGATPHPEGPEN